MKNRSVLPLLTMPLTGEADVSQTPRPWIAVAFPRANSPFALEVPFIDELEARDTEASAMTHPLASLIVPLRATSGAAVAEMIEQMAIKTVERIFDIPAVPFQNGFYRLCIIYINRAEKGLKNRDALKRECSRS